ncbi:MAG: hypothetical protein ACSLE3_02550, partial [Microbacteriaceae bacterium]
MSADHKKTVDEQSGPVIDDDRDYSGGPAIAEIDDLDSAAPRTATPVIDIDLPPAPAPELPDDELAVA